MTQPSTTKRTIYNRNIQFNSPPKHISKDILKQATSNRDSLTTYYTWPNPKPHPTPKTTQKTTLPYPCSSFCYTCQDTSKKLNHSTYNCPYTQCNKCKMMGHHTFSCLEIHITLPPLTKINRKTDNQEQIGKSQIPNLPPLQTKINQKTHYQRKQPTTTRITTPPIKQTNYQITNLPFFYKPNNPPNTKVPTY